MNIDGQGHRPGDVPTQRGGASAEQTESDYKPKSGENYYQKPFPNHGAALEIVVQACLEDGFQRLELFRKLTARDDGQDRKAREGRAQNG